MTMPAAGRGSYGSVYKVRDRVTGQIVAAKVPEGHLIAEAMPASCTSSRTCAQDGCTPL